MQPEPLAAAPTTEEDELALAIALSLQSEAAAVEASSAPTEPPVAVEEPVAEPASQPAPEPEAAVAPVAAPAVRIPPGMAARGRRAHRGVRGINILGQHAAPLDMALDAFLGQPSIARTDSKEVTALSEQLEQLSKQYVENASQILPAVLKLAISV